EIPARKPFAGIYGHDHLVNVTSKKNGLLINPGESCGYLTGRSTVAIWDTQGDTVDIIEI
ncbi:MAG: metallophosphoesterase family protein, partial [Candidatus Brocadiia bacterium]